MLKEFKNFALKGNVMDMAVGIIIGGAFGTIVQSLVTDVIMPVAGLFLGNTNFSDQFLVLRAGDAAGPYATVEAAKEAGAITMNYGLFVDAVIAFLIVAWAVFMLVRGFNKMKKEEKQAPKAPEAPPREQVLLEEIRDLLKAGR